MSQDRPELPREGWREFLDQLTKEYEGYDVVIGALDRQYGDQLIVDRLPLSYLQYDEKDDVFIVAVENGDEPVLRHMVHHPKTILADALTADEPWAIDVTDADGARTLVTLHPRPALPPPE